MTSLLDPSSEVVRTAKWLLLLRVYLGEQSITSWSLSRRLLRRVVDAAPILHRRAISRSLARSATLAFITDVDTAGRDTPHPDVAYPWICDST